MIARKYATVVAEFFLGKGAWLSAILMGAIVGLVATIMHPLLLIIGLIGILMLLTILLKGYKVFWAYLLFLLLGYLLLGKGFAYIGAAPVYVAEIGLALGAASTLVMLLLGRLKTISPLFRLDVAILLIFVGWQASRTIPYVSAYGMDALRDAALWGYAAFAILVFLLIPRASVDRIFIMYSKLLPYCLIWFLIAWVFVRISPLPVYFPGSPVPLIYLKSGDVGVHLAGAAAFLLLRLDRRTSGWSTIQLWLLWGLWLINWAAWGVTNRSGMFSALIGIGIVVLWRPRTQWHRPVLLAGLLLVLLFSPVADNWSLSTDEGVSVSSEQIIANITSTFGAETSATSATALEGTREWRLKWWREIVGYTFYGEYFWTGKGYGINLAQSDGFELSEEDDLRSPHNIHASILARSGVPGIMLWLLFLVTYSFTLIRNTLPRSSDDYWDSRYALWLLAYSWAFLFNGAFDVFLEGPMGGVWFWTLIGIGWVYFTRGTKPLN